MSTNPNAGPAAPSTSNHHIQTTNLNSQSFAPFGEVIQNPATHERNGGRGMGSLQKVTANQGTATKWLDITHLENWYHLAPSREPAKSVVNMFVCKPRALEQRGQNKSPVFPVRILERHPFTPQTFIPLGVSAEDQSTRYLVIVAPTLRATGRDYEEKVQKPYPAEKPRGNRKSLKERLLGARPNPFTNDYSASTTPPVASLGPERKPKGPGRPDLQNLQAFIARGDQAITYGPGTWHAPMVVLGDKKIDFVVVQYANGVGLEDCQEVEVQGDVTVNVDEYGNEASGAGIMRAKL